IERSENGNGTWGRNGIGDTHHESAPGDEGWSGVDVRGRGREDDRATRQPDPPWSAEPPGETSGPTADHQRGRQRPVSPDGTVTAGLKRNRAIPAEGHVKAYRAGGRVS